LTINVNPGIIPSEWPHALHEAILLKPHILLNLTNISNKYFIVKFFCGFLKKKLKSVSRPFSGKKVIAERAMIGMYNC
jgi:hypothetical protein